MGLTGQVYPNQQVSSQVRDPVSKNQMAASDKRYLRLLSGLHTDIPAHMPVHTPAHMWKHIHICTCSCIQGNKVLQETCSAREKRIYSWTWRQPKQWAWKRTKKMDPGKKKMQQNRQVHGDIIDQEVNWSHTEAVFSRKQSVGLGYEHALIAYFTQEDQINDSATCFYILGHSTGLWLCYSRPSSLPQYYVSPRLQTWEDWVTLGQVELPIWKGPQVANKKPSNLLPR